MKSMMVRLNSKMVGVITVRFRYQVGSKTQYSYLISSSPHQVWKVNNVQNGKYHHLVLLRVEMQTALRQLPDWISNINESQNGLSEPLLQRMQKEH